MSTARDQKVNLEATSVLLIDDNPQALDILGSIVKGFGVKEQIKCGSAIEAVGLLKQRPVDLVLIDCSMPEMDGYDFTKWVRREAPQPLCFTPIVVLTGHAALSKVEKSRDCGASYVVLKPLSPAVLLQRIVWLGGDERPFVNGDTYVGPDRRVRNLGPPTLPGRRKDDLPIEVGEATEANMDQGDIDMLFKAPRVSL
jgi:CheY-like chemotaxis protein